MKDGNGPGRWILGSIGGAVLLVLLLLTVQGAGFKAQEQSTPTPVPTPAATAAPSATPVSAAADPGLPVHKAFSDLHDMASGIKPYDARQQQVADLYQLAKGTALRAGVPIQFAEESKRFYQEQAFLAAKVAWEDALWYSQVTAADKQAVAYYVTVLRNGGRNFAANGSTDELRAKGQALLVACQQIVNKYQVPMGECAADLREFLGDKSQPLPAPSPLL